MDVHPLFNYSLIYLFSNSFIHSFIQGNEVETGPVDHLNPQAVDMLTSFVDAYTAENNIKLDPSKTFF